MLDRVMIVPLQVSLPYGETKDGAVLAILFTSIASVTSSALHSRNIFVSHH